MLTITAPLPSSQPFPGWHHSCVRVGDVSLGISAGSALDIRLSGELERFQIESQDCDIELDIERVERLRPRPGEKLFDSGSLWTLYEYASDLIFDFVTPVLGSNPYRRLLVNREFSAAQLLLNREYLSNDEPVFPLEYPLDELLVTHRLARGQGAELHGCGLVDREAGGQLFLGHSGAGKSTTTLLWKAMRDVRILSDDRIILREQAGRFWMHGTPWHGDAGFALPDKAAVQRIFFLEHGSKNEILPLPQARAVAELFTRCFVPFYARGPLDSTLCYLHKIANSVPCFLYRFTRDSSAVETILNFHG
jgi:hypothetical protein